MKTLKFNGNKGIKAAYIDRESESFALNEVIELDIDRGGGSIQEIAVVDNDSIIVEFDDGTEWVTSGKDFEEIYGDLSLLSRDGSSVVLPNYISKNEDRGGSGQMISRVLKFDFIDTRTKEFGVFFDNKRMPKPGLFRLDSNFNPNSQKLENDKTYLLFIHGTASCTDSSFGGLKGNGENLPVFKELVSLYGDNIITFQHKTISVGPIQNTIDLLNALPEGCSLDIIAHSRGGIIADLLARCDHRISPNGIGKEESCHFENKVAIKALFEQINKIARVKRIQINKIIRVACPALGTTLLSSRLDHFLNVLLRGIGALSGIDQTVWYTVLREFIQHIIHSKSNIDLFPGLEAMVPESQFQNFFNASDQILPSELIIIEGATKLGGNLLSTISKILANLYYWEANDLIVNTGNMRGGMRRAGEYQFIRFNNKQTTHFNYFTNEPSQKAILNAIQSKVGDRIEGFHPPEFRNTDRGVSLDLGELKDTKGQNISGEKSIILLLPGIMGSNLYVDHRKIWLDWKEIMHGGISQYLKHDSEQGDVTADSLVGAFYTKLNTYLLADYDVDIFPYDWRQDLSQTSKIFKSRIEQLQSYGQPIKILAHSMGGLVVRQLMIDEPDLWKQYINSEGSSFVMLGTPWMGSHLMMQVLTGHSKRVRQIALLDRKNSKKALLEIFNKYPGIFQLLPLTDEEKFETSKFWKEIQTHIGKSFPIPASNERNDFRTYKNKIKSQVFDFKNTHYIAGKASSTVDGYHLSKSLFGNSIAYTRTPDGDGSVTWKSGIPKELNKNHVYYTDVDHTNLANRPRIFQGIKDLLERGITPVFDSEPPVSRGEEPIVADDYISNNPEEATYIMMDAETRNPIKWVDYDRINVSVVHGDLKMSSYPLMLGHFESDAIVYAEKALDKKYKNILSQRFQIGRYPGKLMDNLILFKEDKTPIGTIIVGLGDSSELTAYNLAETIKAAILDYAFYMRDNHGDIKEQKHRSSISTLCIGSGFGKLSMEVSISAILLGISKANSILESIDDEVPKIRTIEFIEYIDHLAVSAYTALYKIEKDAAKVNITLTKGIKKKHGRLKGLYYKSNKGWWHTISTIKKPAIENIQIYPRLLYRSSSGKARIEEETNFTSDVIVEKLIKQVNKNATWHPEVAKTLFELLIPNSFKEIIRTQNNMLWKLDKKTASYPWEMFHDSDFDTQPTFVNAGLIRQLITPSFRKNPEIIRKNVALVIGDPRNTGLTRLSGARAEANLVVKMLRDSNFAVTEAIDKEGLETLKDIINIKYKILHIAAHGKYHKEGKLDESEKVGIVLGDEIYLNPNLINQKTGIPEFAFINCCYSGQIDKTHEDYYQNRHKLAASIGTQLIEMGVEAVVVAGWKVNDNAAYVFGKHLYQFLLEGYFFGEAVLKARQACYKYNSQKNTWAAYQCYGNPWYQLVNASPTSRSINEYVTEAEVLVDMYNLLYATEDKEDFDKAQCLKNLNEYTSRAEKSNFLSSKVIELKAQIYQGCGCLDEAYDTYTSLLKNEDSDFSIRSIEQYCNVLAKVLVRRYQKDPSLISNEDKKNLRSKLECLSAIGETSERFSLMGSWYKRLAFIEDESNKQSQYLQKMRDYYEKAYEKAKSGRLKNAIYSFSNWQTGIAFTKPTKDKKAASIKLLIEIQKKLDIEAEDGIDFWEDIAVVNVTMCQMLFEDSEHDSYSKTLKELSKKVTKIYSKCWKNAGNLKHLNAEIEHLEFLIMYAEDEVLKEELKGVLRDIEGKR